MWLVFFAFVEEARRQGCFACRTYDIKRMEVKRERKREQGLSKNEKGGGKVWKLSVRNDDTAREVELRLA